MYQVNLLPWRLQRQRQRYAFWLRCFCAQFLVVLIILAAIYGVLAHQQTLQRQNVQKVGQSHAELSGQLQQRQHMAAELARLAAEDVRRQQNHTHNQRYLVLLQQLSQVLPDVLWLTALDEDAEGMSLHGLGGHYAAITAFERRLAALPLLQDCHLTNVAQHQDGMLAFTLTVRWRRDG